MRTSPTRDSTKSSEEEQEKDITVTKWLALIFAFISVYGIAFKLVTGLF